MSTGCIVTRVNTEEEVVALHERLEEDGYSTFQPMDWTVEDFHTGDYPYMGVEYGRDIVLANSRAEDHPDWTVVESADELVAQLKAFKETVE